jgi:hypothetical protein
MDVSQLIRLRLGELRLDQKELANAAQVTESYIFQLRDGMKAPPASGRTDINERTARFLIPIRDISQPAEVQRRLELKRKIGDLRGLLFISTWDIELKTFRIEIVLHSRLAPGSVKQFESVEVAPQQSAPEPGLAEFLKNKLLSADVTEEEIEFQRMLRFKGRQPSPLFSIVIARCKISAIPLTLVPGHDHMKQIEQGCRLTDPDQPAGPPCCRRRIGFSPLEMEANS